MKTTTPMLSAQKALQKYWNYSHFRKYQEIVVNHVLNKEDVIALLPTGGGKSLCYQIPAIVRSGVTLVVSPLIALMEDQVQSLKRRGIAAERLHSGLKGRDVDRILDNTKYGNTKLLYVAPERLSQPMFLSRISTMDVSMIAVDEAHCISQWGHDFRPSYLKIGAFRKAIGSPQIIALTATATPRVIAEIRTSLDMRGQCLVQDSFERSNIAIAMMNTEDKIGALTKIISPESGRTIVYARSRRLVKMIASTLKQQGIKARYYHAGLSFREKQESQKSFGDGSIQVIAATNAFGMGIDISDIRSVVHFDIPPSIEEYYQEIGRAGRDGRDSAATLLYCGEDVRYKSVGIKEDFPPFGEVVRIYVLVHIFGDISIHDGAGMVRSIDYDRLMDRSGFSFRKLRAALRAWQSLEQWTLFEDIKPHLMIRIALTPREARSLEPTLGKVYFLLSELMRNFEEIFDDWVEIDLSAMSRKYGVEESYLLERISILRKAGAIRMFWQKSGPKVLLIHNRLPKRDLNFFRARYEALKKMHIDRWNQMSALLLTRNCRMQDILTYFGEMGTVSCGICDNCRETSDNGDRKTILEQRKSNETFGKKNE